MNSPAASASAIAIARALILKPRLIVLDEPTSALDMSVQAQIVDLLRDLQQRHRLSYIFISHDLRVIRALADEVLVMKDGHVVEQGPADAIFEHPRRALYPRASERRLLARRRRARCREELTHGPALLQQLERARFLARRLSRRSIRISISGSGRRAARWRRSTTCWPGITCRARCCAYPRLKAIFSLGAGVEKLLRDPDLPKGVPIVRMVDPSLTAGMTEYVLLHVLRYHRRMPEFEALQRRAQWAELENPPAGERRVGILGPWRAGQRCGDQARGPRLPGRGLEPPGEDDRRRRILLGR